MWYKNVRYFAGDDGFIHGCFCVENGRFVYVGKGDAPVDAECTDLGGAYVLPGLVDIHIHGAAGSDFSDGDKDGLIRMAQFLLRRGITSFMPTSMTLPYETLDKAFQTAAEVRREQPEGASRIVGIHMEGPFVSKKKCGSQNPAYLKEPDAEAIRRLQEKCGGLIRIVDAAPELPGAEGFASQVSEICRVSAAHTDSGFEDAARFFAAGARHLTHLFNAMPPIHHRNPGVIGAASERRDVTAELICDGFHVHPAAVAMAFKLFPEKICLISDALRCIAGAATDLYQDLRNAIAFGIPAVTAIKAATINPAAAAGWDDRIGSIEEGKIADFLICDDELNLKKVVFEGKTV